MSFVEPSLSSAPLFSLSSSLTLLHVGGSAVITKLTSPRICPSPADMGDMNTESFLFDVFGRMMQAHRTAGC